MDEGEQIGNAEKRDMLKIEEWKAGKAGERRTIHEIRGLSGNSGTYSDCNVAAASKTTPHAASRCRRSSKATNKGRRHCRHSKALRGVYNEDDGDPSGKAKGCDD